MTKYFLFAIAAITMLYSCSSESDQKSDEKDQISEDSNGDDMPVDLAPAIDSVWNYYAGTVGIYDSQILMELSFNGTDVNGTYWYTKHGKPIRLEGSIDSLSQEVNLTEKVNGKITGHFKFDIEVGMIRGSWSLPNEKTGYGYEPSSFYCDLITTGEKGHLNPEFNVYELNHDIEIYNSEIDDFEFKEATDIYRITKITDDKFVFIYDVTAHNYHKGFIEGTGTYLTPKLGQFKDGEGCELLIKFYDSEIEIIEKEDCGMYKGARAYFGGTLTKVK